MMRIACVLVFFGIFVGIVATIIAVKFVYDKNYKEDENSRSLVSSGKQHPGGDEPVVHIAVSRGQRYHRNKSCPALGSAGKVCSLLPCATCYPSN